MCVPKNHECQKIKGRTSISVTYIFKLRVKVSQKKTYLVQLPLSGLVSLLGSPWGPPTPSGSLFYRIQYSKRAYQKA